MSTDWLLQDEYKVYHYAEGASEEHPEDILLTGDAVNSKSINWIDTTSNISLYWAAAHYYLEYGEYYELGVGWIGPWNAYLNRYGIPTLQRGLENSGILYTNIPSGDMIVVPPGEVCKVSCPPVPYRRSVGQAMLYWSQWPESDTEETVNFEVVEYDEEEQWFSNEHAFRLHSGKPYSKASAYVIWDNGTSGTFRRLAIQLYDTANQRVDMEWENIIPADIIGTHEATQYVETEVIPNWMGDFLYERNSQYVLRAVIEHDAGYQHGVWEGRITVEYYG